MMRGGDLPFFLPLIFLVIPPLVFFSRSILLFFVALGLVQWLTMARIVRGQVLSLKNQNFVEAARALGAGDLRIIFGHIVPNTLGPVIVYTTLTVPAIILQEAFLSFLGLGVQPPDASWGVLDPGRDHFPELEGVTVRVGLTKQRSVLGLASIGATPMIWIRPRRIRRFAIAHELTHLLHARGLVPGGEKTCDLYTLARSDAYADLAPFYLKAPDPFHECGADCR